jgi:hypothetical protein
MTDPDLWLIAAIALNAPHLSRQTGFLMSAVFLSFGYYLRNFR